MWVNILLPKEMNSLWKHELYAPLNTPSFTFTVDFCPLCKYTTNIIIIILTSLFIIINKYNIKRKNISLKILIILYK